MGHLPKDLTLALQEPNLLEGKKPVGQVEIDRDNPLSRNLEFFALLGGESKDIVNGLLPSGYGSSYVTVGGNFFNDDSDIHHTLTYSKNDMPDLSGGFTVFFDLVMNHAHNDTPSGFRTILDTNGNLGDGIRVFHTTLTNNPWRFRLIAGGVGVNLDADSLDFSIGDSIRIYCSWDTSTMRLFENGKLLGSIAHNGTLASTLYNDWLFGMAYDIPTPTEAGAVFYKSSGVFIPDLSESEISKLDKNIYQILKPATTAQIEAGLPVAGGGGATVVPLPIHNIEYQFVAYTATGLKGGLQ